MDSEPTLQDKWDALTRAFGGVGLIHNRNGEYEEVIADPDTESLLLDEPEELLGTRFHDHIPEQKADELLSVVRTCLETDETRSVEYSLDVLGGTRWFHSMVTPVSTDGTGTDRVLCLVKDITERKEYEQELERYETIVEASGDLIYTADADGHLTYVNDAFVDVTGYGKEELLGAHASKLMTESDLQKGRKLIRSLLDSRQDRGTFEMELHTTEGTVIPSENQIVLLPFEEEFRGSAGVIRDITDRKERERQLAVLDRVLRHNLRNDMNVILGRANRVVEEADGNAETAGRDIVDVGQRLLELVEKERELTTLIEQSPDAEPIVLYDCVRSAVEEVRTSYPDAGVSIAVPESVQVSAVPELRRAVFELCENAIRHTDRDRPTVEVRAEVDADTVELLIVDDGPTIPEKEREIVTGEIEIGPLNHGSGMGLRLVEWIVSQSRGTIAVESGDRRGNVIRVALERADGNQ
jgi:PAS domain S-box-containing protein